MTVVHFLKRYISSWPNIPYWKYIAAFKRNFEFGSSCFVNQVFYFLDHLLPFVWLKILFTDQCLCVAVAQQMSSTLRSPPSTVFVCMCNHSQLQKKTCSEIWGKSTLTPPVSTKKTLHSFCMKHASLPDDTKKDESQDYFSC